MASGGDSPFHWLGLLKWSLAYSDGTRPSNDAEPMSKEDVEFLEKVMKEGIIDEGERMKSILSDLTDSLEAMLVVGETGQEEKRKELGEKDMLELLYELQDIVEQIDYARVFMAMGGIPFLMGCATYNSSEGDDADRTILKSIRKGALGVLSTMCQNNPPVQLSLLEHGHMPHLIQLFFDYTPGNDCGNDGDDSLREKAVQALSASIRGHAMAEHIFCQNERGRAMLQVGMGMQQRVPKPSARLRKRSLFLLRAILISDCATGETHKHFRSAISYVCTNEINEEWEEDAEIREMGLVMLSQLLRSKQSISEGHASKIILLHKTQVASIGIARIQAIRKLKEGSEEREYASLELDEWESLMVAIAEAGS